MNELNIPDDPDITVVIPYWDLPEEWLTNCIDSVRSQDVRVRILVIDNESKVPVRQGQGVEVMRITRRASFGSSRNFGLEHVATPWVVFLDCDDALLPGALRYLCELRDRHPNAVALQGAQVLWNSDSGDERLDPWPHPWMRRLHRALTGKPSLVALFFSTRLAYPLHGALLRTDEVRAAGGFADVSHAEDWPLTIALALRGPLVQTTEPVYNYRRQGTVVGLHTQMVTMSTRDRMAIRARIRASLRDMPGCPAWLRSSIMSRALAAFHWGHNYWVEVKYYARAGARVLKSLSAALGRFFRARG